MMTYVTMIHVFTAKFHGEGISNIYQHLAKLREEYRGILPMTSFSIMCTLTAPTINSSIALYYT